MTTYAGEVVGKREHFCIAGGECKLVQPLFSVSISEKISNNLPQDPVIPLLGIYPKDAQLCHKDMCSTMFIAALFGIARAWG